MAQLQTLLGAMHLPGETSFTLTDLAFPGRTDASIQTWLAHSRETTAQFAGPITVTVAFALIDTLAFVPAYGIVLCTAAAAAHQRLRDAGGDDPLLPAYRKLTAAAFLAVPLLVIVDVLENVDTVAIVAWKGDAPAALEWGLTVLWGVKWTLAIGTAIALLLAGIALARRSWSTGSGLLRTAVVLRVEVAVVVFLGVFLFFPAAASQMDDVMRRWIGPDWTELIATSLLTVLLSAVIIVVSWRRLLRQARATQTLPLRIPLLVGLALIVAGLVFEGGGLGGRGLVALGAILVAIGALSYPIRDVVVAPPAEAAHGSVALPALLAALPPVLVGLAAVRASVFELVYARNGEYVLLVLLGLALQAIGWGTYVLVSRGPEARFPGFSAGRERRAGAPFLVGSRLPIALASLITAVVALSVWLDPWRAGDVLGTVGALATFLTAIALLGYGALQLERRWLAPPFFLVFGLRRFPVILIVIAWAFLAALLDPGGFHDVRTTARSAGGPVTLERAWERWLGRQPPRQAVPLVLVAAEGGGIRAAYWTARALDCAVDADYASCGYVPDGAPGDAGAVFAASGISGGSLGLVAYSAAVRRGEQGNWMDTRLGDDFLAASGAWMLFADLPNALLKLDFEPDRAAVLEEAWERAWDSPSPLSEGMFASWASDLSSPLLLLNGTSVQDGCRVNTSVLNADVEELNDGPALRARDCLSMGAFAAGSGANPATASLAGTHDLVDLLCPTQDVRLSTAALLSARFPWVSPAARVPRCDTRFATFVVDGGYFDTSAASPLQELWARLEPLVARHNATAGRPCVVPVLLQLDNHYKEPRSPGASGRPWEAAVPIQTVRAARDARENGARQAVALLFAQDEVAGVSPAVEGTRLVRYAHLFPRAHPGTSAPLGWALSQASMDDLTNQLRERANANEFGKIRRWFSPALSCAGP